MECLELHGYGAHSTFVSMWRDIVANIDQFYPLCPPCAANRDLRGRSEYFDETQIVSLLDQLNVVPLLQNI